MSRTGLTKNKRIISRVSSAGLVLALNDTLLAVFNGSPAGFANLHL
jgi:hypothetical protein